MLNTDSHQNQIREILLDQLIPVWQDIVYSSIQHNVKVVNNNINFI